MKNIETEFARQLRELGVQGTDEAKATPDATIHTPTVNTALVQTNQGNSESIAWSDLLTEFSQLPQDRINAALKRLTPNALSSIEGGIVECRDYVKQQALERAKLYLIQQGIPLKDMAQFLNGETPTNPPTEIKKKRKARVLRSWFKGCAKEIKSFLTLSPKNLDIPTGVILNNYKIKYPELTSSDISRIKYEIKKTK